MEKVLTGTLVAALIGAAGGIACAQPASLQLEQLVSGGITELKTGAAHGSSRREWVEEGLSLAEVCARRDLIYGLLRRMSGVTVPESDQTCRSHSSGEGSARIYGYKIEYISGKEIVLEKVATLGSMEIAAKIRKAVPEIGGFCVNGPADKAQKVIFLRNASAPKFLYHENYYDTYEAAAAAQPVEARRITDKDWRLIYTHILSRAGGGEFGTRLETPAVAVLYYKPAGTPP